VVIVKSISGKAVLTCNDRDTQADCRLGFPVQHIVMPYLHQRAIAKKPQIFDPASSLVLTIRRNFLDMKCKVHSPRACIGMLDGKSNFRLAAIFARDFNCRHWTLPGINIGQQAGIEVLVEEDFYRKYIEGVVAITPEDLVPGTGRTIKEPL